MLLPNARASPAPTITFIDAIKALYKHDSPIRKSFGIMLELVFEDLIIFRGGNYWYVPFTKVILYATDRNSAH